MIIESFTPSSISAAVIHEKLGGNVDHSPRARNKEAVDELYARLRQAAKLRRMITYSELVRGIKFECPEIKSEPFEIVTFDWSGLDRKFIGGTLAQMLSDTILETGCIITSIIVDKNENAPSSILFDWLHRREVIPDLDENTVLSFWIYHVKKTYEWFKTH